MKPTTKLPATLLSKAARQLAYKKIPTKTLLGLHDRLTYDQSVYGSNHRNARRLSNLRQELNYRVVVGKASRIILPSRINSQ